jgi:acyl-CoA reductase-like NAD-dependent aldehyde dehydrogenase
VNEAFKRLLVERTRQLVVGDPRREETFVGPLISERDAQRLQEWIAEAEAAGGRVLTGGGRTGACLEPTLLEAVPRELRICTQEAFGPVAVLSTFASFDEALAEVNDSAFGLQAGVFTRDLYRAQRAWDELEVGGVVVGDVPSWRVDTMPYGGVKDSGLGREGVRYAMEDMTEPRLLVVRTPPGE